MSAPRQRDVAVVECSAPGAGGVSVLRVEGEGAFRLLAQWGVHGLKVGELRFARLELDGEALDEVLLCVHSAQNVEVHVHGSPPLVQALVQVAPGCERDPAQAGVVERAREALAHAPCELAARVLLDQTEGAWERECRALLSRTDADLQAGLDEWLQRSRVLRRAFEPARVLIAGPVNAGKSTLFNALVGSERVITSEVPGTTRDLVVERAQLGLWPIVLIDSAGQRGDLGTDARAQVERAGQVLARAQSMSADWVLWLVPPGGPVRPPDPETAPTTSLASCTDRPGAGTQGISTLEDPVAAVQRVSDLFHGALDLPRRCDVQGHAVAFDAPSRGWLEGLVSMPVAEQRQSMNRATRSEESRADR